MAETSRGIVTPNQTDRYKLVTDLNTMATSIDEALKDAANTYRGTSTQRTQFTSQAPEGTIWVDTNGEKIVWVKQGASWRRIWPVRQGDIPGMPYAMAAGRVTISFSNSSGASVAASFPSGRFSVPPNVTLTRIVGAGAKYIPYISTGSISTSGCTIGLYSGDGSPGTATAIVTWQAIQMTSASADG